MTREVVGRALELIPPRILDRIRPVEIAQGPDRGRHWGGVLHRDHVEEYGTYSFYSDPDIHQLGMPHWRRRPVVSLNPYIVRRGLVDVVLHELGHALYYSCFIPHRRARVYWDPGRREIISDLSTGLLPDLLNLTDYAPGNFTEQFAEAFALWLIPPDQKLGKMRARVGAGALYKAAPPGARVGPKGLRHDNRSLLALFNELAGWPGDTPPLSLRP